MTKSEFARSIKHGMFGVRDNMAQAMEYANSVAMASENPAAVITAVQVVLNTVAQQLEREVEPV